MRPLPALWKDVLTWVAAVAAAMLLAFAGPSERQLMGSVPPLVAQDLNRQPLRLPAGLPAERTLALVGFQRGHASALDTWVHGLGLRHDAEVQWLRMAVVHDPGDAEAREAVQSGLQARYPNPVDRAHLVPVFTDRDAFVRAARLPSAEQVYALVLSRSGEVLARADGAFDQDKARALMDTLRTGR